MSRTKISFLHSIVAVFPELEEKMAAREDITDEPASKKRRLNDQSKVCTKRNTVFLSDFYNFILIIFSRRLS